MVQRIKFYGCGGAGANLVQNVIDIPSTAKGHARPEYVVIDTADANFNPKCTKDKIERHLIPGVDGGGRDRAYAARLVRPHITEILNSHPPADFNVVIFSLSGASGSTIGPMILSELIKRNVPVVAIVIGNFLNFKEATNTRDGFSTLQAIAEKQTSNCPVNFHWVDSKNTRAEVDARIEIMSRALAVLVSGENLAMDSRNIVNWLNFNTVVKGIEPQLMELVFISEPATDKRNDDLFSHYPALSVASLLHDDKQKQLDIGHLFDVHGYVPLVHVENTTDNPLNLHFMLMNATLNQHVNRIIAECERVEKDKSAAINTTVMRLNTSEASDDGIIV